MSIMTPMNALLAHVAEEVERRRCRPASTYRVQFNAGFTFRAATRLIDYLHELGITHLYASPYLKARPGSSHGYDISEHDSLNPEIGTADDYQELVTALHVHDMGQVFDMVPNHMGIVGNANTWWNDVLENGPASPYSSFFDIDWYSSLKPGLQERVLLPLLGNPYGEVLESGQLKLAFEAGGFAIHYFEHRFPISPCTYDRVLEHRLSELQAALGSDSAGFVEYQSILTAIKHLPHRHERELARTSERLREKEVIKRRLATLVETVAAVGEHLNRIVSELNGTPGDARSFDLLDALLSVQAYRLSYFRVAADEINYRRFFDINELAALSMERPEVFAATHALVLRLLRDGTINGLRIDHPDGLYNPREYLVRLQRHYVLELARGLVESHPEGVAHWQEMRDSVAKEIEVRQAAGEAWL